MSPPVAIVDDRLGAFVRDTPVAIDGASNGPLTGLTCGIKDAFDIWGYPTGVGNPDWLRTHPPASHNAAAVDLVLNAGASIVGKTQTDELTYSLNGENIHYGTPVNPHAPGRIPGGSSSGSAVAVAGELVDFALGTDCGGSVRAPASFCGIYGMRPSHGSVSVDGVFRLAPSFDTVGWFARDARLLERVGEVLLPRIHPAANFRRIVVASDAFAWCGAGVTEALQTGLNAVTERLSDTETAIVAPGGLSHWFEAFRTIQGSEIWHELGTWIRATNPQLAPSIRERLEWTATITADDVAAANRVRADVAARMNERLADDAVLCLPTTPDIAPLVNLPSAALAEFRSRALSLLCIAGLARLPQINLPLGSLEGCPIGLSIVGPRGSDRELLALAASLTA
ncbi:MAG: amidase [Pirellulales bacterium]